ncbi:MAG: hypothetical protein AB1611_06970 [bacterium]
MSEHEQLFIFVNDSIDKTDVPHFPFFERKIDNDHHPHPDSPATGAPCIKGEENSGGSPLRREKWKGYSSPRLGTSVDRSILPQQKSPPFIKVSLMDGKGRTVDEVLENALLPDKNFKDFSGLFIGLTRAERIGGKRILIITDNILLQILIKSEAAGAWKDSYGFHADIKRLMNNFEEVKVEITGWEKEHRKAA